MKWRQGSWKKGTLDCLHLLKSTEPNVVTYASLLRWCADVKDLPYGKHVHAHILRSGFERYELLGSLLVQIYSECGALEDARALFAYWHQSNALSWNFLVRAHERHGEGKKALQFFEEMQSQGVLPDKFTLVGILSVCASKTALREGKRTHSIIAGSNVESDVVVGNALINMYGKCGSVVDAQKMFERMSTKDVVSWNGTISVLAQNGQAKEALEFFEQMQLEGVLPDKFTFVSVLDACASQAAQPFGKRIQALIVVSGFQSQCIVGTALMNMYGKCGNVQDARSCFDEIPHRDVISWNAMIAAYAQNGKGKEAFMLCDQMQLELVLPNRVTLINVLEACAAEGAFSNGKRIHALSVAAGGIHLDLVLGSAVVNMYSKCGSLKDAETMFDELHNRNVITWTTMIAAYSQHGHGDDALNLFAQMQQDGIMPNEVTFVGILSACSHAGLVDEGCHCFVSMAQDHCITAVVDHYNCMIDLLGRAGQLDEAERLTHTMPIPTNVPSQMALLGACRHHADVERGQRVAKHVADLEPENSAPFIMLSNIYVAARRVEDAAKLLSWINNDNDLAPGCLVAEIE